MSSWEVGKSVLEKWSKSSPKPLLRLWTLTYLGTAWDRNVRIESFSESPKAVTFAMERGAGAETLQLEDAEFSWSNVRDDEDVPSPDELKLGFSSFLKIEFSDGRLFVLGELAS